MKTSIKKFIYILSFAAISISVFSSCASNKPIPEDLTAQELIQNGQNHFERGHYKEALRYYNAVTERYTDSLPLYVEASYEIAHLFMKQKKYNLAQPILQEIVDLYKNVAPGELPGAYQKLAQLELNKIK